MIKILIFFIFSLIMLRISWPDQEIREAPQPSSDDETGESPVQSDENNGQKNGINSIFQRFMILIRLLPSLALTLRDSIISETHGRNFYRFLALEFMFLLILVNFGYWLKNPFTFFRLVTWLILFSSFLLAFFAIFHLLLYGKPQTTDEMEIPGRLTLSEIYKHIRHPVYTTKMIMSVETTTSLVMWGAFKYIRHPLYASLILFGAVTFIKNPSMLAASLFCVATVFIYAAARAEEKENLLKFGDDYAVYMKRSKMFFSVSIFEKILGEE